jgi:hypothetical protein
MSKRSNVEKKGKKKTKPRESGSVIFSPKNKLYTLPYTLSLTTEVSIPTPLLRTNKVAVTRLPESRSMIFLLLLPHSKADAAAVLLTESQPPVLLYFAGQLPIRLLMLASLCCQPLERKQKRLFQETFVQRNGKTPFAG